MEFNKTIYLLENAIHNDIFFTFRNYGYNFINFHPKVLIDILTTVLIRTITGLV